MDKDFAVMKFQFMGKLAVFLMMVSFILFTAVIFVPIPEGNAGNANTIVGFIILEIGVVIGFYFGASQSQSAHAAKDGLPSDDIAIAAAANIESNRIAAAKADADKKEMARLEAAKVIGKEVIEAAKTDSTIISETKDAKDENRNG